LFYEISENATTTSAGTEAQDAGEAVYSFEIATNTDAAITGSTVNQHLYNIELLLLVVVVLMLCDVVHRLFRSMFNNLLK
jgi:hypothetical protein